LKRPGVACVCLLLKGRAKWTEGERQVSQAVLNAGQVIEPGFGWVKSSRQAIKGRAETKLEARMDEAAKSRLPDFENFVTMLRRDK